MNQARRAFPLQDDEAAGLVLRRESGWYHDHFVPRFEAGDVF